MISRSLFNEVIEKTQPGKVLVFYGPRRVGKTILLQQIIPELTNLGRKCKLVNGENAVVQSQLSQKTPEQLHAFLEGNDTLIIDEAQNIENIGSHLKLLIDTYPNISIIASGSAAFDLAQKVGEPLTGRKKTLKLYPLSAQELINNSTRDAYRANHTQHILYGGYPELQSLPKFDDKQEYLEELVDAYLFKDILTLENVRGPKKLRDLLILLAHQIGNEVSLSELGNQLDLHKDTVHRYLDLFEKTFILINIRGFSRNLRKEVTKTSRYYFWDNGIRNALIRNYNPPKLRNDIGMLWENYIVTERIKKNAYTGVSPNYYFWRTYDQQEIDLVEEYNGHLSAYEIKRTAKTTNAPASWKTHYPNSSFSVIDQTNFLSFIT